MNIYEILIRGSEQGEFLGGHVIYFGSPIPQKLDLLTGGQVPSWLSSVSSLAKSKEVVDAIIKENESIKKQLGKIAPNLSGILDRLLESGLTAWADRAVANYNLIHPTGSDSLTPLVVRLYTAATVNDIQLVVALFGEILAKSQILPTNEESIAMQAILNEVQFPIELINFNQWIV